jgi:uncharacterized protein (TIGR03000 family)
VQLPRDARLYVDEVYCPLPGESRTFDTPPLDANRKYYYTLTVEVTHDEKPVRVSRRAIVQAGKTTEVNFGDRAAIIAAASLKEETEPKKQPDRTPGKIPGPTAEEDTPDLPNRPPPTQVLARLRDGSIDMVVPVFVWVEKQVPYQVEKDGKPTTQYRTVKVANLKLASRRVSLRDAKVIDTKGKVVSGETLARVLDRERAVLLTDQDKVDPFYLSTLKDGTLIVLAPPEDPRRPDVVVDPPVKPPDLGSRDPRPHGAPPLLVEAVLQGEEGKFVTIQLENKGVMTIEVAKASFSTAGGKPLTANDLKRYLSDKPVAVIVSSDSMPVHVFHLQLYDPETLVVVPPLPNRPM